MSHFVPTESILIQSPADLPAAIGGVITLPEDRVVVVEKSLQLPDQTQLLVPDTSILRGRDTDIDGIQGTFDGPMIVGAGNGLVLNRLFLVNESTDPNSACARASTNPLNPRVSRFDNLSVSGERGIELRDCAFVSLDVILDRCRAVGLDFQGQVSNVQVFNLTSTSPGVSGKTGIRFSAGSIVGSTRFSSSSFLLADPTAEGVNVDPGVIALSQIGFADMVFTGPGIPLVGVTPDSQSDVIFLSSFGIPNSRFGGDIAVDFNPSEVTAVPPPTTFVPVGQGNPAHPSYALSAGSARVGLIGGPDTATQQLQYQGPTPLSCTVHGALSLFNPAGNPQGFAIRVVQNAGQVSEQVLAPMQLTGSTGSGTTIAASGSITWIGSATLQPGDTLQLQVANQTNIPDPTFVVTSCALGFLGN